VQPLALVIVSGLIVACSTSKTIVVPEFSIAVKLSETAQKKLQAMHESVLVIAYFDGDPLPGKGKDNSPMRGVVLGNDEKLVDKNNVATFSDTKISQATGMISPQQPLYRQCPRRASTEELCSRSQILRLRPTGGGTNAGKMLGLLIRGPIIRRVTQCRSDVATARA
jgi:hypothetical protein